MIKKILFSIIIPTSEINQIFVDETVHSLQAQTYRNFEAIVLTDICSTTCRKIHHFYPWLTIIHLDKKNYGPAQKRNRGVRFSHGRILVFLDADAYAPKNWLRIANTTFNKRHAAAICGPGILPKKTESLEKIFDGVSRSAIGSGNLSYRFEKKKERYVDDYPTMNFFIRRSIFDHIGGFCEEYWPGEDSKFCNDLVYKEKQKILYTPNLFVYHHRRNSLKAYIDQHGAYGYHRGYFFAQGDQNSRKILYLFPAFFVIYLIFMPIMNNTFYALPFYLYCSILAVTSFIVLLNKKNIIFSLGIPIMIFFTHIAYGLSFYKGLSTFWTRKLL